MDPEFWREALKQVPALTVVCVGGIVMLVYLLRSNRHLVEKISDIDARNSQVMDHVFAFIEDRDSRIKSVNDRIITAFDRNTEAFGRSQALTDEVRELRRENANLHQITQHAVRDMANVAGLQHAIGQHQQAHRTKGYPPGGITIETPPATVQETELPQDISE